LQSLLAEGNDFACEHEAEEHLAGLWVMAAIRSSYILGAVLVVPAVVGVVGEVDACSIQACVGEAHVEAVIGRVDVRRLGVVGAMEEQLGQIPNAALWIFLERSLQFSRELIEYRRVVDLFYLYDAALSR